MKMLKSSVAKAVAAVIALSAGSAAFAQSTGPNEVEGSDLFVAVWNSATNTSYVQDLGSQFSFANLTGSTFNSNNVTINSAALDGGNLNTALGAGTYQFNVFAGDLITAGNAGNNYQGNSFLLSQTAGLAIKQEQNNVVLGVAGPDSANYLTHNAVNTAGFLVTDASQATNPASQYWASTGNVNAPGGNFGITNWPGSAAANGTSALNLVYYQALNPNDGGTDIMTASFIGGTTPGLFTLNGTTDVLSYTSGGTPTVPLPAAAWLLVSGLLGLGAVGRRKTAAAAQA
jgi:hypothetical protein